MSSVAHPGHSAGTAREERPLVRTALESSVTAVAAIWLCSALIAVLAPDMITGAQQEHLPIASLTVWVWTATATAYVLMATRGGSSSTLVVGITAIWVGVLVAAVAAPLMVTGTDPTQIPLAVLVAPPVGAITTGFLALQHAGRDTRHRH